MIDMKKLRKIAEKATPGPWFVGEGEGVFVRPGNTDETVICDLVDQGDAPDPHHYGTEMDNGIHIATFDPSTCLALLDRIDKLEDLLKRAKMAAKPFIRVWTKGDNPTRATLIVAWDHVERIADVSAKIKEALDDRP